MQGAGWSNASSPGFSGADACWSAGSSILRTSSASSSSLASSSSSGDFEIGSSLSGTTNENVTKLVGDILATGLSGNLSVTAAHNTLDHTISIITGSGKTSIADNFNDDTVTVNATALANNTALMLSGSATEMVTGLTGDILASGLT